MVILVCLFEGCTFNQVFNIIVNLDETVDALKQAIKEKENLLKNTPLDKIRLHCVKIPFNNINLLKEFKQQDEYAKEMMKMDSKEKLSYYFDDFTKLSHVHVIIESSTVSVFLISLKIIIHHTNLILFYIDHNQ